MFYIRNFEFVDLRNVKIINKMTLTIGCTDRSTGILADGAEILAITYQVSRQSQCANYNFNRQ